MSVPAALFLHGAVGSGPSFDGLLGRDARSERRRAAAGQR